MFTGIIQDIGEVAAIEKQGTLTLTIAASKLPLDNMAAGASIACNGICLTVIAKEKSRFKVQLSGETLKRTTASAWQTGTRVNLEPALRAGDEFGGHIVAGHIDGLARVMEKRKDGGSLVFQFAVPEEFAKFIAPKGSIAIDGVSLTVNEAAGPRFSVTIIPHTQNETTLPALKAGDKANFEIDLIARYAGRLLHQA